MKSQHESPSSHDHSSIFAALESREDLSNHPSSQQMARLRTAPRQASHRRHHLPHDLVLRHHRLAACEAPLPDAGLELEEAAKAVLSAALVQKQSVGHEQIDWHLVQVSGVQRRDSPKSPAVVGFL